MGAPSLRGRPRTLRLASVLLCLATLGGAPAWARSIPPDLRREPIDPATPVDHDGQPIPQPKPREPSLYGSLFRDAIVEPISRGFDIPNKILWALGPLGVDRNGPATNVNHIDEVPNSSWFTNRNHVRALTTRQIEEGPFGPVHPTPPYTIKRVKTEGFNPGFTMKDAAGARWVVKLDRVGYPRISSGAGVVSSRLVWAAGYNISHDEAFTFRREEITLDPDLASGKEGRRFDERDLTALLERGARSDDGRYYAAASLFLPGSVLGPMRFRGLRHDDPNDRFHHQNRRELRGLYVVYSWINNWDVKDQQSLDTFQPAPGESLGHVTHYLLDVNASLGAAAEGAKPLRYGYEQRVDPSWIARRLFSLGFVAEPWRRVQQGTGIPSVGNFTADGFVPDEWRPNQFVEPFRHMTLADAYWGAKVVASFSDRQIAAAIDAAGYEDPRAPAAIHRVLCERRDRIARHWFGRAAPLDFFQVRDGALEFHDLAVDRGLEAPRRYRIEARGESGPEVVLEPQGTEARIPLQEVARLGSTIRMHLSVGGSQAKAVRVMLVRKGSDWTIAQVRHG